MIACYLTSFENRHFREVSFYEAFIWFSPFSMGFGMTLVLIFPKNFLWVSIAISLMIVGYNMFCR